MIKKAIIRYKTAKNIKKHKSEVGPDFRNARRIGILYDIEHEATGEVAALIDSLTHAGKDVSTLTFCMNRKKLVTQQHYFDPSDLSLFGEVKGDHLHFFINQSYDYFICLDSTHHFAVDYVLSLAKSPCRVGPADETRIDLYELMIKANSENEISSDILRYLKMIHHDA